MSVQTHSLRLVIAVAIASVLGACTQSSEPPAQANANPAPPAQTPPSAPADAAGNPQQNATLSELLAPSQQQPGSGTPPPGAAPAPPPASEPVENAEYATVVSVTKVEGPQQVCHDETVVEKRPQEDKHKVAGTAIGAIVGGVIGNQFGGGRGRTVATVGGAVAGGAIGHKVQENHQNKDTVTRVVKRCHPVAAAEAGRPLYDIVYSYQGQTYQARLDYDPGDRIELPVRSVE